ncbi:MAG: helix-turn-helix domain-containing protein [Clostridiales bacterium]|nr:helix-turn-helix domain-containing protein [Clostridiales bacterium]
MQPNITEIAERIRALREIMEISPAEMARTTGVSEEEYTTLEAGEKDFSFTFLFNCAERFGVDMIEILTGENPHLSGYCMVRKGTGLPIKRRQGFKYEHLAATFRDKISEPFLVTAPYIAEEQENPIALSVHEGQEFDYILSGSLKFVYGDHAEILQAGDSVYYDSGKGHGMIAVGGEDCVFISVVMRRAD